MSGSFRHFLARSARRISCSFDEARFYTRSLFGQISARYDLLPVGKGGGTVLVLSGFMAGDTSTRPLRQGLRRMGYHVFKLGNGRNRGVDEHTLGDIDRRVRALIAERGEPLILVGWSLGGLIAREYAKVAPDNVRLVVTLGSPFSGDVRSLPIARVYEWLAGHRVDEPPIDCALGEKPPVPTTAIWSRRDSVVPIANAKGDPGAVDMDIGVDCAHLGYCSDVDVMLGIDRAIAATCPSAASRKIAASEPASLNGPLPAAA